MLLGISLARQISLRIWVLDVRLYRFLDLYLAPDWRKVFFFFYSLGRELGYEIKSESSERPGMKTAFIISGESLNSRLYSFSEEETQHSDFSSTQKCQERETETRQTDRQTDSCPVLSDMFFSEPFSPFPLPWLIHFPT